jgi:acyl-coenzyme A synthetase/AMP-(fatty) acid ligase
MVPDVVAGCLQVPRVVLEVEGLPRNAMGKINKKELLASYLGRLTATRK